MHPVLRPLDRRFLKCEGQFLRAKIGWQKFNFKFYSQAVYFFKYFALDFFKKIARSSVFPLLFSSKPFCV